MGGPATQGAAGIYGTQGTGATGNIPTARFLAASWTDNAGNFWLFGGSLGSFSGVFFNDLWEYTPLTGKWTWVSGSNTSNAIGVYGVQGVAAASNVPGARINAVSWTDTSGNLWLFGGEVYQPASYQPWEELEPAVPLNDLWKFNTSARLWTWIGGSNGQTVDTTGNTPPPAVPDGGLATSAWTDRAGNFWLFGNPLWEYTPSTGLWAQVGTPVSTANSQTGGAVYGTEGVAAPGNYPGSRQGAVSWSDPQGNFWLFSGGPGGPVGGPCTDDMWEYTPSTGEWMWVSGSNSLSGDYISGAVYGTLGVAAPSNSPGCRYGAMSWADNAGNIWLYGGYGYFGDGTSGELWEYNISTKQWTWLGSGSFGDYAGAPIDYLFAPVYGSLGVAAPGNSPGPRTGGVTWVNDGNHLWLFGGANGDPGGNPNLLPSEIPYNDFWMYVP